MGKILDSIKEQHELEIPLTESEINWLIEEAEKLNDIKKLWDYLMPIHLILVKPLMI